MESVGSNWSGTLAPKISVVSLYINLVNIALAADPNKTLKYYDPFRIWTRNSRLITHELQLLWTYYRAAQLLVFTVEALWVQSTGEFVKENPKKSGSSLLRLPERF